MLPEIRLDIIDLSLMPLADPWKTALAVIDRVGQEQGVLTINWHQNAFNPWEYPERHEMYIHIVQECRRRGVWVGPLGEIAD